MLLARYAGSFFFFVKIRYACFTILPHLTKMQSSIPPHIPNQHVCTNFLNHFGFIISEHWSRAHVCTLLFSVSFVLLLVEQRRRPGKWRGRLGRGDVSRQEEHVARGRHSPAGATSESIRVRCSGRQRPNNDWQLRRCGEWRIEARVCEKGNKVMT